MNALMQAAQSALQSCGLWKSNAVLLCAVSGGCDSTALLHCLCRLRGSMGFRLHALHVQHGLRGRNSLADERFVREVCRALNVPLAVVRADLTGDMHTPGMETMARQQRRIIFEQQLTLLHAHALLTAHHLDDQAETVLMHLLRGSGLKGLCGMTVSAPFGPGLIVRPFLTVSRQDIRSAMLREGLAWREDESNQQTVTPRNALRLSCMPELERLYPNAGMHLAQLAQTIQADEAFLHAEADRLYQSALYAKPPFFMLRAQALSGAHDALLRRVLRRWFDDGAKAAGLHAREQTLSQRDTLLLAELARGEPGGALNLPCGLMASHQRDWLHLVFQNGQPLQPARPLDQALEPGRSLYALDHITLSAAPAGFIPRDACSVVLPPEWLARRPVLRQPQPGDRIHPFGAPGQKPLRRFLTDRKVDPLLRSALPVLCVQKDVLWIPGLCASRLTKLDSIPQGSLQLTLSGDTPFLPKSPKE